MRNANDDQEQTQNGFQVPPLQSSTLMQLLPLSRLPFSACHEMAPTLASTFHHPSIIPIKRVATKSF